MRFATSLVLLLLYTAVAWAETLPDDRRLILAAAEFTYYCRDPKTDFTYDRPQPCAIGDETIRTGFVTRTSPLASSPADHPASGSAESLDSSLGVFVFFVLILIVVAIGFIWLWQKQKVRQRVNETIRATVSSHSRALVRKRYQTLLHDDYGNLVWEPWDKELAYFVRTVLEPAIFRLGRREYAAFEAIRPTSMSLLDGLVREHASRGAVISFGPNLSPVDFEHFCAEQLRLSGWQAQTTKATGDQGSDIIAEKNGLRVVLQCKLYNHPVGNKAVQEIAAARNHEQADYAVVITNSRYTAQARQLAATNNVLLLHHTDLTDIDNLLGT